MSEPQSELTQPPVQSETAEDEINLIDLLIVVAKHKKMILSVTFAAALLSVGISLLQPNIYTGTTKILPPQSNKSSSLNSVMLDQLGGLAGAAGGALGLKDPNALYISMMKSRTICEKIVNRFSLQKVYEQKTIMDTLKALEKESTIASGKDGVITVEVDDKDPQRAADMANAYVEELNSLLKTLAITEASQRRQFFDSQLKPAKDRLTDAEVMLDRTPTTSLHYLEALRNLKYQESIYQVLAKQFEVAKLDEAKDSPLIQVLDKAYVPERKSKPKRSLIVIVATLIAFFLAVIWAFVSEAMQRAKEQPDQAERLAELSRAFRFMR